MSWAQWKVIVHFVDIGGFAAHHCSNFYVLIRISLYPMISTGGGIAALCDLTPTDITKSKERFLQYNDIVKMVPTTN